MNFLILEYQSLPVVDGFFGVVCFSFLLIPALKMNSLYCANVLNGVLCVTIIIAFAVKDIKHFPRNMEDMSVREAGEVSAVSYQVEEFCLSRGVDRRRAMLSGLAMEDMAGNIVTHGFSSDNKNHSADIRVTCQKNFAVT